MGNTHHYLFVVLVFGFGSSGHSQRHINPFISLTGDLMPSNRVIFSQLKEMSHSISVFKGEKVGNLKSFGFIARE